MKAVVRAISNTDNKCFTVNTVELMVQFSDM